jgi:protoporphyrinogen oxidase
VCLSAFLDLFKVAFSKKKLADNYAAHTLKKYGRTLYELDFEPYTHKVTKTDLTHLHTDWGQIGLNRSVDKKPELDSIYAILKSTLGPKKHLPAHYMDEAMQGFVDILERRCLHNGVEIHTGATVEKFEILNGEICGAKLSGMPVRPFDHIVWTASPNNLADLLGIRPFAFHYVTTVFYNVAVKGRQFPNYELVYYVDPGIIFNRIYNTRLFSDKHAPEGCFGYCCEVTCKPGSDIENDPQKYIPKVVGALVQTGAVARKEDVLAVHAEVMTQVYPLCTLDYREQTAAYISAIYGSYRNLSLSGRSGLFWYSNIDHTVLNALDEAEALLKGERKVPQIKED